MVAVNCANFQENLLESELFGHEKGAFTGAHKSKPGILETCRRGTLLLDEIGDMPLSVQAKLLRVIESGEYRRLGGERLLQADFRLISATHRDLEQAVTAGTFRRDLFYRINVVMLRLPPLKERPGDIPLLVDHFLKKYAAKHRKTVCRIGKDVMARLKKYSWPGNVRELENIIERGVILTPDEQLHLNLLPPEINDQENKPTNGGALDTMEKDLIAQVLRKHNWNRKQSALELGISVKTLYRKIKEYGLQK